MQYQPEAVRALILGTRWGIWSVVFGVLSTVLGFLPSAVSDWLPFILMNLAMIFYILLLRGVRAIALAKEDQLFLNHLVKFMRFTIALWAIYFIFSFSIGLQLMALQLLLTLIILICVGIASIHLGKDFMRLVPELGKDSRNAGQWCVVSGWLMATVLLSPLGGLFSLVADYYMWKLVRREVRTT